MSNETIPLPKVGTIKVDTLTRAEKKHAFFLSSPYTNTYIMQNGNRVLFRVGTVPAFPTKPAFVTDVVGYIKELQEQMAYGHPELHTEPGYETVTDAQLDPLGDVKQKAVEDFLASEEFKKHVLRMKGIGTPEASVTDQGTKLSGIATTDHIKDAAGESSSVAGPVTASAPVSLASLKK